MYCSECGVAATGKFCSSCGARLGPGGSREDDAAWDWSACCEYPRLVAHGEVRELLTRAAAQAPRRLSGEQFLEACDKMLGPVTGGVPIAALAKIAQPLNARLGMKTGKSRQIEVALPVGRTIVSVLCWLARTGRKFVAAEQLADGCTLRAELPSDLFSFAGELSIVVTAGAVLTHVAVETSIPGQLFDWGKSHRCLDELTAELGGRAAA